MRFGLPCPVLLRGSYPAAADHVGISAVDVERIVSESAALRDGKVLTASEFFEAFPDDSFDEFTGERLFPESLSIRFIDVPRDPAQPFTPPITDADRAAHEVWASSSRLRSLQALNAPSILLQGAKNSLQIACEALCSGRLEERWLPLSSLMTGAPAEPHAAGPPDALFALRGGPESDETTPGDAAIVAGGVVVAWHYLTIVFALDGTIRDVFPTCDLRVVGSDARYLALVCGGGSVANSGHFGGEVHVRDTVEHGWLPRGEALPSSLPRFVAGTLGDVRWAVVIDVTEGVGYRTSPLYQDDQCGETFSSGCGRFVWDRGRFVLEAATGDAVLDVDRLTGVFLGFAKTEEGWRFLMISDPEDDAAPGRVQLVDETGAVVRDLGALEARHAFALSPDGRRLVHARTGELRVCDADSGVGASFDLSSLAPALRLPNTSGLWQRLAAAHGAPSLLITQAPAQLRETLPASYDGEEVTAEALADAIDEATRCPRLPDRVELLGSPEVDGK
jgi:hypothetical protein